jgi:membrane-associated phospholipid phosphatase
MKKQAVTLVLLLILLFSPEKNLLFGGNEVHDFRLNKQFLESFSNDFLAVTSSPKGWSEKDVIRLGAVIASGSFLFAFDGRIRNWIQDKRSSASEDISRVISPLGNGFFLGGSLILVYAAGEIAEDCKLRKTALLCLESWIISGVVVTGLKVLTGRARPYSDGDSTRFSPFSLRSSYHSFPSGHASAAFAVATTIADQSENLSVDVLSYCLATLAALSRIHDDKHWASDVFIGAAIGYFISKKIVALNRKESQQKLNLGVRFSSQNQTIVLTYYF